MNRSYFLKLFLISVFFKTLPAIADITIQENAPGYCSAEGVVATAFSGYTGPGYIDINNSGSAGIDYKVSVLANGNYTFTFRYANDGSESMTILVNGASSSFTMPKTGSWLTWGSVSKSFALKSGVNTIRLKNSGASERPNIDSLQILGNASPAICGAGNSSSSSSTTLSSSSSSKSLSVSSKTSSSFSSSSIGLSSSVSSASSKSSVGSSVKSSSSSVSNSIGFTEKGAWFESAYAEWSPVKNATRYEAYYKLRTQSDSSYVRVDNELVRGNRVDVLGLIANQIYTIKVIALNGSTEIASAIFDVTTNQHDRTGFAFSGYSPLGNTTGGYNLDGSVPANAKIVYVTNANKDTVTLDVITGSNGSITKAVGLAQISDAFGKGRDTTPTIFRFLGTITSPSGFADPDVYNLFKCKRKNNVTIEGVGKGARISGWGIEIRDANNIEVRNLGFGEQPDDGISIQSNNRNIWVHHNEFFWGKDMGGDKTKGDGSIDIKSNSSFITVAYNAYHDTGKAMGLGFTDPDQFYVSFHHNFFNGVGSRSPRTTKGSIHVFNNYYYDIETYAIGVSVASHVFVENNYFEMSKRPMMISSQGHDLAGFAANHTQSVFINSTIGYRSNATQIINAGNPGQGTMSEQDGGALKQIGNYMDAYSAAAFYEPIDSGNGGRGPTPRPASGWVYSGFDTSYIMYNYTVETAVQAKETVLNFAGRLGADNRSMKTPPTNQ